MPDVAPKLRAAIARRAHHLFELQWLVEDHRTDPHRFAPLKESVRLLGVAAPWALAERVMELSTGVNEALTGL
jgi:hypothetical protein